MARINALGLDKLMDDIAKEAAKTPKIAEAMVDAGGEVLVDEVKRQIKAMRIWDTGATWYSIKKRPVKYKSGESAIEVWPAGRRKDDRHPSGERVETVAFIAEYGTSKVPARPFMSTAVKNAERQVVETMMRVWEEYSE